MNKEYKIKLDLNKKLYNQKMAFNQFDENVNDFYIEVTKNNEVVKDLDKSIITLVAIKPNNAVDAQFIEVKEGQVYADLKPSMCDLVGNYQAKAMIVLEGEIATTDTINYSVNEDKIISRLNDDVASDERFPLFTDALSRLSTIETNEEQRIVNEAERILSEENRKIEEAKRVEAELIRQHEEADRAKYDATRESNENIRKQNESLRLANETNRIDEEAKRVEEESKRVEAEQLRKDNYNFMTEDEERRRVEANAHKEAEKLRVQAETNRVNEEAKRRTIEQARVSAENTRVSNENTRKASEVTRQTNETQRVEAETQRQNRYNSFILDAEANANNFENYTNTAKVKEEERKSNELDRKSQEAKRVSNEVERISNENTRKANEVVREKNETSRQYVFENKVDEVDKKIIEINATKDNFVSSINTKVDTKISELNTTKDNFVSSVNTKVDNKISEIEVAKSDMTNTVSNKVNEVETRFNALTSSQQQDAEVIDARDGETSLKARLDRDIEKAKQVYVNVEGNHISTDSSSGYAKDVEILGNTVQDASNLADIRSVGDKVEGQELYEIPVLSVGKNLFDGIYRDNSFLQVTGVGAGDLGDVSGHKATLNYVKLKPNSTYKFSTSNSQGVGIILFFYDKNKKYIRHIDTHIMPNTALTTNENEYYIRWYGTDAKISAFTNIQIEEGTVATPYEPYQEDKLTILSPVQLEKVGDVRDRIIEKDGVLGIEKWINKIHLDVSTLSLNTPAITNNMFKMPIPYSKLNLDNSTSDGGRCITTFGENLSYADWVNVTKEGVYIGKTAFGLVVSVDTVGGSTINRFNDYFKNKNHYFYRATENPTFIPLPHSQQVKLRTFANKTNISFGCEIEGTIKAQVPKSLGATVNTHTEQINNLNKELDRVKKLEESTVSTVTTESDFTTVEQTTNGYFEDVKIEGKTLVNLVDRYDYLTNQYYNTSYLNRSLLKPNTIYTVIVQNTCNNDIEVYCNEKLFKEVRFTIPANNFVIKKLSSLSEMELKDTAFLKNSRTQTEGFSYKAILLEGDHTQNPPSYFEGLKSVGQSATTSDDGVDEISVESVNENLFDIESYASHINSLNDGVSKVELDGTTLKSILIGTVGKNFFSFNRRGSFICTCEFVDATKWRVQSRTYDSGWTTSQSIKLPFGTYDELKVFSSENTSIKNIQIKVSETNSLYVPHKSDKKRLLYYNNETQAWEKPILREWDSIEKHADGKYYYHKRSGEVVLNGSESWSSTGNDICYGYQFSSQYENPISKVDVVCDKLLGIRDTYGGNRVGLCVVSHNSKALIRVGVSQTSVEDFKQWLQANNVTVVYQLAEEKVYECTNIDLITYANETNYIVESGAIAPKTTLKVHNNISNVVSLLQKKVSLLESNVTSYMITQNRLMLASRYNADTVSFKVDVASFSDAFEYDNDLYELILNNVLVGKDNYNREYIENLTRFYWMDFVISDEMYSTLFEIIEEQHNPKIEEETPLI